MEDWFMSKKLPRTIISEETNKQIKVPNNRKLHDC